jgi:hypothetical protein
VKYNRRHSVLLLNVLRLLLVLAVSGVMPSGTPPILSAQGSSSLQDAISQVLFRHLSRPPLHGFTYQLIQEVDHWAFGNIGVLAPPDEEAGPEGLLFLAHRDDSIWVVALENTPEFYSWFAEVPTELLPDDIRKSFSSVNSAGDGSAQLSLPWNTGETWRFTGGPHSNDGSGNRPWSSLDFAGGSGMVRAAREGTAYRDCENFVRIVHADGWQTGYYHLSNIAVQNGQSVSRGQYLGNISMSTGCGGRATGAHVHFSLRKNGSQQEINGRDIGGWTITETSHYNGCMTKGNTTRCADVGSNNNSVYNDGAVGSGGGGGAVSCPDDRNGVILYQHWNFDCGGKGENDGYIRRNDSGLQNVSGGFNDKATSVRVPSGWSVKLFENGDRGGGWACRTSDDDSFSDDNRFNRPYTGLNSDKEM